MQLLKVIQFYEKKLQMTQEEQLPKLVTYYEKTEKILVNGFKEHADRSVLGLENKIDNVTRVTYNALYDAPDESTNLKTEVKTLTDMLNV